MSRIVGLSLCALLAAVAGAQTPVLREGISLQKPITMNAVTMPDADMAGSLIVSVTFRGAVFPEVTLVTPARLSETLKVDRLGQPGKKVYLKGDARTPYLVMAEVLSAKDSRGRRRAHPDQPARLFGHLIHSTNGTGCVAPTPGFRCGAGNTAERR
jgi:biopolymer transport protein ExbD